MDPAPATTPPPDATAARHVLLVAPVGFGRNVETVASNTFQAELAPGAEAELATRAEAEHRALVELLSDGGVDLTLGMGDPRSPDALFCNNWFSTHPARGGAPPTLVLYPMHAPNRRLERRPELVELLSEGRPRVIDLTAEEDLGRFLEGTGSLVLDRLARVAYAARSPRTDLGLARRWAEELGYRLIGFEATDEQGRPYYHTNVAMFLGHGLAGVCLDAIENPAERDEVVAALAGAGHEVLPLSRAQIAAFAGNGLALRSRDGAPRWLWSSGAWAAFTPAQQAAIERRGKVLHTDLTAIETLGGGSARCLVAELFDG